MIPAHDARRWCPILVSAMLASWIGGAAGSVAAQDTQSPDSLSYEITLATMAHYLERYGVRDLFATPAMAAGGVRSDLMTLRITDPGLLARQVADSLGLRADATPADLAAGAVDLLIYVGISAMRDSTEATVAVTRREQTVGNPRWTEYESYYTVARTAEGWAVQTELMTAIRHGGGRHPRPDERAIARAVSVRSPGVASRTSR